MPINARLSSQVAEMTMWRRDLHAHPELGFEEARTSDFVAEKLRSWGAEPLHEPQPALRLRRPVAADRLELLGVPCGGGIAARVNQARGANVSPRWAWRLCLRAID
jgi:metal-dependent amidase/aminoacylase/carboxypeptidase family protein